MDFHVLINEGNELTLSSQAEDSVIWGIDKETYILYTTLDTAR